MTAYLLRPAVETDWPFIRAYWSDSYRTSRWAGVVPNNRWADVRSDLISQLRARGASAWVACSPQDADTLLAFLVHEGAVVHYLYTKQAFRRLGLARDLLRSANIPPTAYYTHRTPASAHFPRARFAPEIARRARPQGPE